MNTIDVDKKIPGIHFNSQGIAEVVLWAPLARNVEIKILASNKRIPLNKKDLGYWELSSGQIRPGDRYTFIINNKKELPDPASRSQPEGVHGPSQVIQLNNFKWEENNWKNIPLEDYVLYELHTGTFTPEGTFKGIVKKLNYLKDLGINVIELLPVASFPGNRNWGYDGVYPYAVQHSYGGAEGLQQLVNACHQKGIAVVLDVVYNHLGPEGNYLSEYGPYFTDKHHTPWGKAINFDDDFCDEIRKYFIENVRMWFKDFHIDGLRLDAVHAIKDFSPKHILKEIKEEVDKLMNETGRKYYLIAELDLNDNRYINPLEKDGYGMDAQWIDEFHHSLRVSAGQKRSGYYADFDGIDHLAKAFKDAYVYDGIYSPHRQKNFGVKAEGNPGKQFVVFSQNHDQVGNRMLGERTSQLKSFEMQKLLAGAVMVSPYLPMLFMGEEYSEPHPFLYFVSHTDPDLVDAVRKGRKAEFAAFQDQGEAPDPQAEKTFQESMLQWDLLNKEPHRTMLRYYQKLISLRKNQAALKIPDRKNSKVQSNKEDQTLILQRRHAKQSILCFMNFSEAPRTITVPESSSDWQRIMDSASPEWKGPTDSPETISASGQLTIQPESILIYSDTYV